MAEHLPPNSPDATSTGAHQPRDWPAEATAFVVRAVDQAKAKTTRPATLAARGVVYCLIAAIVGIVIAFLLFIGLFRAVDVVRDLVVEDSVWLTYLVLGLALTIIGALVFSRRKARR